MYGADIVISSARSRVRATEDMIRSMPAVHRHRCFAPFDCDEFNTDFHILRKTVSHLNVESDELSPGVICVINETWWGLSVRHTGPRDLN